ncbi:MAG: hypothetical protein R3C16_11975 [Hyphomonadaceae bacterium]
MSVADFNGDSVLDIVMVVEDDITFGRENVHQYFRVYRTAATRRCTARCRTA